LNQEKKAQKHPIKWVFSKKTWWKDWKEKRIDQPRMRQKALRKHALIIKTSKG
jgi:hypothetical protein